MNNSSKPNKWPEPGFIKYCRVSHANSCNLQEELKCWMRGVQFLLPSIEKFDISRSVMKENCSHSTELRGSGDNSDLSYSITKNCYRSDIVPATWRSRQFHCIATSKQKFLRSYYIVVGSQRNEQHIRLSSRLVPRPELLRVLQFTSQFGFSGHTDQV